MLKKPTEINISEEIPTYFAEFDLKSNQITSEPYEILYKSIENYGFIAPLGFNLTKIICFDKDFDIKKHLLWQRKVSCDFMRDTFPLQILHTCITTAIQKYWRDNGVNINETLSLARHIGYEPTKLKAAESFVKYTKKLCNYDELYYKYGWNINHSLNLEFPVKWLDLSVITTERQISKDHELNGAILADWVYEGSVPAHQPVSPIHIVGIEVKGKLQYVSATTDLKQFFYDMILNNSDDKIKAMMQKHGYKFITLETCSGDEKWITIERKIKKWKGIEGNWLRGEGKITT